MPESNIYIRGLTHGVALRYVIADVTDAATTARDCHKLNPDAAKLCAEAMVASMLLANQIKGEERLTVMLASSKPHCTFMADVHANGQLRAKLTPNKIKSAPLIGQIQVIKHNSKKELYRGITDLNYHSIESAMRTHLKQSSQISSLLRICCTQNDRGEIQRAIGVLIELLPPTNDIEALDPDGFEEKYAVLRDVSSKDLISILDSGQIIGHDLFPLEKMSTSWACTCSQERVERMLCSLGPVELRDMLEKDGQAEVNCDFCNKTYLFDAGALGSLLALLEADSS
jgi:molecular chaperone Hsp33